MMEISPYQPTNLTPCNILVERLSPLLGKKFHLTGKSRTDGSNLRKMVIQQLEKYDYEVEGTPDCVCARKGVPKIKRELIDTYIVTTGSSYNLQVWNRIPNSHDPLIQYSDGRDLCCCDARYTLIRIEPQTGEVLSIVIMTAEEIERRFGKFGVPTIKWQLIINESARERILRQNPPILIGHDLIDPAWLKGTIGRHTSSFDEEPKSGEIIPLADIKHAVERGLLNTTIETAATKNRGQNLELRVIRLLGYDVADDVRLAGGYPDLPNQALEIKIQDSPTVDLGKYSPQFEELIFERPGISTTNMRYLIALMDELSDSVAGIVLCSGRELGEHFTYVADKSYKCQRSIPMSFFDNYIGQAVYLG